MKIVEQSKFEWKHLTMENISKVWVKQKFSFLCIICVFYDCLAVILVLVAFSAGDNQTFRVPSAAIDFRCKNIGYLITSTIFIIAVAAPLRLMGAAASQATLHTQPSADSQCWSATTRT